LHVYPLGPEGEARYPSKGVFKKNKKIFYYPEYFRAISKNIFK
jgi:hypothetical protein